MTKKAAIFHPDEIATILNIIYRMHKIEEALGHVEDAASYLELYEALKRRVGQ